MAATQKLVDDQKKPLSNSELDEFHADNQRRSNCLRYCCLGLAGLVFVTFLSIGWLLTASGLVSIPFISNWAYQPPRPIHEVVISPADRDDLNAALVKAQQTMTPDGVVTVAVTESQLTAALRQSNPEITVGFDAGRVEWFMPIKLSQATLYLTAVLEPQVKGGHLRIHLVKLKIGQLGIPTSLLNWAGELIQTRLIDTNDFIKQVEFETVQIEGNQLIIRGKLPPSFLRGA